MSTTYLDAVAKDRRLVVLRLLLDSAGYTANEYILQTMLERFGHVVSADLLRTELSWLTEQQLITVDEVSDVQIARLTARGEEVARGRAVNPGVKRPRAG